MLEVGLEPTRPCEHRFLRPTRIPFRHSSEKKVEPMGVEPTTSCMPCRRSPKLSYGPIIHFLSKEQQQRILRLRFSGGRCCGCGGRRGGFFLLLHKRLP